VLLLTTKSAPDEAEFQRLHERFIKQVAEIIDQQPDLLWIRDQLFDPATSKLKN
jgi:hypothetical protein